MIRQITNEKLDIEDLRQVQLVLVGNSIGYALARLYAQEYPGAVAALLLLNSVLSNSDYVSIWPDLDAKNFDSSNLPEGVTPDLLRETREKYR